MGSCQFQPVTKRHGLTALGIEPLEGIDVKSLKAMKVQMQAGLTQGEVAARMGTAQSVVACIESGRGTPYDLFQGQERDIRRMNVGMTRAKRKLLLVGD